MNCPRCGCRNTVEFHGVYQCGCCGLVFHPDDQVVTKREASDD